MALKPHHLVRYKEIGLLLAKHVRAGIAQQSADAGADAMVSDEAGHDATKLAQELEKMGPTFVKLGQVLSTRSDLLPPVYLDALHRLQDKVEPFPFADVERTVTTELGVRLSKAFASFDHKPLAAASLGQVHRAEMRDGRAVAVKVQRPDIRARIVDDMDAIGTIAEFADAHTEAGRRFGFCDMVEEFRQSLMAELDYRREADNLRTLGHNLARRRLMVVPRPIADYSTGVVLTMDYVAGRNIANLGPLARLELDGRNLAEELFSAYLDQILVDGFFHADPHPGNVLLTDDGRLALIDLGMVARVAPEMQDHLVQLLLAISQGKGRDAAEVAIAIGQKLEDYDRGTFTRQVSDLVGRNQNVAIGDFQAGALVGQLTRLSGECGLRLPPELTMLGKTLLNLDEVARILDPTFDPNAAIRREGSDLMRRKLLQTATPGNMMAAAMEAKEFTERLPGRVNKVMDALAEGELKLRVQGIDEKELIKGIQKLANRLTTGMVVAALVVGAALIMRIPTRLTLLGYPALAIVLFLMAGLAGAGLLVSIQLSDLPQRKGRRRRRR